MNSQESVQCYVHSIDANTYIVIYLWLLFLVFIQMKDALYSIDDLDLEYDIHNLGVCGCVWLCACVCVESVWGILNGEIAHRQFANIRMAELWEICTFTEDATVSNECKYVPFPTRKQVPNLLQYNFKCVNSTLNRESCSRMFRHF